ncbi:hypothetical protein TNCV_1615651 [Trichonephila clavipes]|nr:hypothetical protein TNCV_1615651 [Trichonephila clavipes]
MNHWMAAHRGSFQAHRHHAVSIDAVFTGQVESINMEVPGKGHSACENAARSVEPITVHNIFNHDSTASMSGRFDAVSVDGRITTILTAVVKAERVERRQALMWIYCKWQNG